MNKQLIIRYIEGRATEQEKLEVLDWIEESEENRKYFNQQKNFYAFYKGTSVQANKADFHKLIAKQPAKKQILSYFQKVAAILLIPLLIGGTILFIRDAKRVSYPSYYEEPVVISNYTAKGVKGNISLPDGSKVWLNSDTRISFPEKFIGDIREVKLEGEAYFEVVSNPNMPMIVKAGKGVELQVKGTVFNLSTYGNDDDIQATLVSGAVDVITSSNKPIRLSPNESLTISDNHTVVIDKKANLNDIISWKDGKLIFSNSPLSEVLKKLERWHGYSFEVKNSTIFENHLTASLSTESIVQVLELLKSSIGIRYTINNMVVTLY